MLDVCRSRGFTFVELLVVLMLVAMLALVGVSTYKKFISESYREKAKVQLNELAEAIESQYYESGVYEDLIGSGDWTETNSHFTFAVVYTNDTGFQVKAVSMSDPTGACGVLTLDAVGTKGPSGCW
ncbi:MAG: type IV pilin protein [Gammaproteobacteria bacterium]